VSTVNQLSEIAKNEKINLEPGEIFLVRDLFKGHEWNRISRSEKLLLGTFFLSLVKNTDTNISIIAKTSSDQQKYQVHIEGEVY